MLRLFAVLCLLEACSTAPARAIQVGAKSGDSQRILGEAVAQTLEAQGLPVTRRFDLGQTLSAHEALRSGDINLYVECTGQALAEVLHRPRARSADLGFQEVQRTYAAKFGLTWLPRLGFDDPWVVAMRADQGRSLHVNALSQLGAHSLTLVLGMPQGFRRRTDGLAGLSHVYGLGFREAREMDAARLYPALRRGEVDLVVGRASDAALAAPELVVLRDDMAWFGNYEAAPLIRRQALADHRDLREALAGLVGRIRLEDLRRLDAALASGRARARTLVQGHLARR